MKQNPIKWALPCSGPFSVCHDTHTIPGFSQNPQLLQEYLDITTDYLLCQGTIILDFHTVKLYFDIRHENPPFL